MRETQTKDTFNEHDVAHWSVASKIPNARKHGCQGVSIDCPIKVEHIMTGEAVSLKYFTIILKICLSGVCPEGGHWVAPTPMKYDWPPGLEFC